MDEDGRLVDIGDTKLFVVERGGGYPLLVLHGGPGADHHMFGDYLDPLADEFRLILVHQRAQGRSERPPEETWTLEQMSRDVISLAGALGLPRYAVLGHSFGAFVALQHAVNGGPGSASQVIVSSGLPSSSYLAAVNKNLESFEPIELRDQVAASWAREATVATHEEFAELHADQAPFHFANPLDPRIEDYNSRTSGARYSPEIIRLLSAQGYGGIEVEERLGEVKVPVLVLGGRYDRACVIEGSEAIARGIPGAELVIFEESAHMTFVEENEKYITTVRAFLKRTT